MYINIEERENREEFNLKDDDEAFGESQNIFERILGCWHLNMSRPITTQKVTYRYCVKCGLRRNYDLDNAQYIGTYYSPTVPKTDHFV